MINVTDLRNGAIFLREGAPCSVLTYTHIKMARGGAVIKLKVKNLINGSIKEISLNNGEKVNEADVENRNLRFLYKDHETLFFMDMSDYSQYEIPLSIGTRESQYLIEGKEFQVVFFENRPISVILPQSMFFKVESADPAVKGNTAVNATKNITLENGLIIEAPQFIKAGETVKINTETGTYSSRGK